MGQIHRISDSKYSMPKKLKAAKGRLTQNDFNQTLFRATNQFLRIFLEELSADEEILEIKGKIGSAEKNGADYQEIRKIFMRPIKAKLSKKLRNAKSLGGIFLKELFGSDKIKQTFVAHLNQKIFGTKISPANWPRLSAELTKITHASAVEHLVNYDNYCANFLDTISGSETRMKRFKEIFFSGGRKMPNTRILAIVGTKDVSFPYDAYGGRYAKDIRRVKKTGKFEHFMAVTDRLYRLKQFLQTFIPEFSSKMTGIYGDITYAFDNPAKFISENIESLNLSAEEKAEFNIHKYGFDKKLLKNKIKSIIFMEFQKALSSSPSEGAKTLKSLFAASSDYKIKFSNDLMAVIMSGADNLTPEIDKMPSVYAEAFKILSEKEPQFSAPGLLKKSSRRVRPPKTSAPRARTTEAKIPKPPRVKRPPKPPKV